MLTNTLLVHVYIGNVKAVVYW